MTKLLISVRLSDEYQLLNTVKRVNYPYKKAFQLFMLSVIRLSNREHLDPYRTIGRIGYALANDKATDWITPEVKGDPVHIRYGETNEEIISYYADVTDMTNKQLTTLFLRLMTRLCYTYGPHITDLVYLIDNLGSVNDEEPDSSQSTADTKRSTKHVPKTDAKQDSKIAPKMDVPKIPLEDAHVTDKETGPDTETMPTIRKRKTTRVLNTNTQPSSPTKDDGDDKVTHSTQQSESDSHQNTEEDTFLARAQRLKEEANAALDDTPVVSRNPLLDDFYDE